VPEKQAIPTNSQLTQLVTAITDLKGEQISPINNQLTELINIITDLRRKQNRIYKWKRLEVILSIGLVLGLFVGVMIIKYKLSSFGDI
jgi:hypothetical protein